LKEYLTFEGVALEQSTPRHVVKQAFATGVIPDGQIWIDMLEGRNAMSHQYDEKKFDEFVPQIATRFLPSLTALRTWLETSRRFVGEEISGRTSAALASDGTHGVEISKWVVGTPCGFASGPAPGRTEFDTYVEYRREDSLRQMLDDPEPAARVYGMIGLLQIGVLPYDDFYAQIVSIRDGIEVCESCLFSNVSAFQALYYY
jgi:hypothetical protein